MPPRLPQTIQRSFLPIGFLLAIPSSVTAEVIDFGSLTTNGGDDGNKNQSTGWTGINTQTQKSGDDGHDNSGDGPNFWAGSEQSLTGTISDGDQLSTGNYRINFIFAATGSGGTSGSALEVYAYAWDGTSQTLLNSVTLTPGQSWKDGHISFKVNSLAVGQQLQLKFTAKGGWMGWDTISGSYTTTKIPILISVGGVSLGIKATE